eukprot:jgi/Hompol1/41/HPOL_005204-RA
MNLPLSMPLATAIYTSSIVYTHAAVEGGHLDIAQYLHSRYPAIPISFGSVCTALRLNRLAVVWWLLADKSWWQHSALSKLKFASAQHGHMDLLHFAIKHDIGGPLTVSAMNGAAGCGHLHTVRWLHENRMEGCTTHAMDSAAMNGHLTVIKYLFENRTEGCSSRAMIWSAKNGHLETFMWLWNTYPDQRPSVLDMADAALNGHFWIIEFFAAHTDESITLDLLLANALAGGHLQLAKMVLLCTPCRAAPCIAMMTRTVLAGHLECAKWLHKQLGSPKTGFPLDLPRRVMDCFSDKLSFVNHQDIIDFLVHQCGCDPAEPRNHSSKGARS